MKKEENEALKSLRQSLAKNPSQRDEAGEQKLMAPIWKPQPGAFLSGSYVANDSVIGKYGVDEVAVIELDEGGRVGLVLGPEHLKRLWKQEMPSIGDDIAIQYFGKKPQNGKLVHRFSELHVARKLTITPPVGVAPRVAQGLQREEEDEADF